MYGIEDNQFGQDSAAQASDDMVGRIMSAEYNLAVQRGDSRTATNALARMFGQWLANRFSR